MGPLLKDVLTQSIPFFQRHPRRAQIHGAELGARYRFGIDKDMRRRQGWSGGRYD